MKESNNKNLTIKERTHGTNIKTKAKRRRLFKHFKYRYEFFRLFYKPNKYYYIFID